MPSPVSSKKGTNQFMRMGHTSGCYGNEPTSDAHGDAGAAPKDLKP